MLATVKHVRCPNICNHVSCFYCCRLNQLLMDSNLKRHARVRPIYMFQRKIIGFLRLESIETHTTWRKMEEASEFIPKLDAIQEIVTFAAMDLLVG